ncbi:hypothetical protein MAUB1S_06383 [Mycolicibacterium aubagnense]
MDESRVYEWESKFLNGDHSDDNWFLEKIRSDSPENEDPLLFKSVSSIESLIFLEKNGINLLQRAQDGSTILMDNQDRFDTQAYRWLANYFRTHDAIDIAEEEGITPLASKIRFGEIDKARILLENGASIGAVAKITRYGGKELDIPTQAVLSNPIEGEAEETAIQALKLLTEYGFKPNNVQKEHMLSRVGESKNNLRSWIEKNL